MYIEERCPSCNTRNLVYTPDEGFLDTDRYSCWSCRKEIIMVSGEEGDKYDPHVDGERKSDDLSFGLHEKGLESV